MNNYILDLKDIDKTKHSFAGGKGVNLGELFRIDGIYVPEGICISAEVFKKIINETSSIDNLLKELSLIKQNERNKIADLSSQLRSIIENFIIPENIRNGITLFLSQFKENIAFAVRSSATAEDLPSSSFAGQHETYLNIIGNEEILKHISKCWASLFTERAVIYRLKNGFDHRKVFISVIIQRMINPQVSGIMFTADPVTSNRRIISIDASFGLGEALVSGLVNADTYKVLNGKIIEKGISAKRLGIYAANEGGTKEKSIDPDQQYNQALPDEKILQLEQIGRKIEEHFGSPQDIEWCLAEEKIYIVQSRPITTLFPVPEADDLENHVYLSVGHQQMMTDPMKPLGLSFFLLTTGAPMKKAAGRLFVDITRMLTSPGTRHTLINTLGNHDPLIKDALLNIMNCEGFVKLLPEENPIIENKSGDKIDYNALIDYDPAIVSDLISESRASLKQLKEQIHTKSGPEVFDFIREDIGNLKKFMSDQRSMNVIMTAMNASFWINDKMFEWLGDKNTADTIALSVPNNITSEMGLALLDIADSIRPYPEIIKYLQNAKNDSFLDELVKIEGGLEVKNAINNFLDKYGMRCPGEIDITNSRWSEKPSALIPIMLTDVKNFSHGAGKWKFEEGLRQAMNKEHELIDRLKQLPGGEEKAKEAKRMISLIRNFSGYREYPKYFMVSRYFIYKQALMKEAEKLVQNNVIYEKKDVYYLTFDEYQEAVKKGKVDMKIISERKDEYKLFYKLTPPRVITSDGEIITGKYKRENLPGDVIPGLPVSAGVVEGRARVILNIDKADLEDGDILVTTFTDPGWTPLFLSIKGLVTEVGGLMTHGAVIAREYGLPAVVGVENATRLIKDGQRIRVNGTEGYIQILQDLVG